MNSAATSALRRPYRQGARATAAEATAERILGAFIAGIRTQWFEDVTLEAVAREAGVTVQTVLRRFGDKDGLLAAATQQLQTEILGRRAAQPGDIEAGIAALNADYEAEAPLMLRLLAQEDRHGAIRGLCDIGRASHRAWVAALFAPWLNPLPTEGARERLDALVVATDVYVWKLIRVDLERPAAALRTLMLGMIHAALNPPTPQQEMQP